MKDEILRRFKTKRVILPFLWLLIIVIGEIVLTSAIPLWREYFYNILQTKNYSLFHTSLVYFGLLLGGLGIVQGFKVWSSRRLAIRIRTEITETSISKWVGLGAPKLLNYGAAQTSALEVATSNYLQIVTEIVISLGILVLLVISSLHQPLVIIYSLIYTILASGAAYLFNKPMINSDAARQEAEGDLRESISLYHEHKNKEGVLFAFYDLVEKYYFWLKVNLFFTLFSNVKGNLSALVPYLFMAHQYFTGAITLGQFMGIVSTFELFVVNATILIQYYPALMTTLASRKIINKFFKDLTDTSK